MQDLACDENSRTPSIRQELGCLQLYAPTDLGCREIILALGVLATGERKVLPIYNLGRIHGSLVVLSGETDAERERRDPSIEVIASV
jgi:hypothetical protein